MEDHPTGFRFHPTEEELISFYLHNQLEGSLQDRLRWIIPVLDICATKPWNLPELSGELCREYKEQWFFFAPMQEREARGGRPSRSTAVDYWKVTGSPSHVYSSDNGMIGMRKSMVFYVGKAPAGRKTKWKLNEYRATEIISPPNSNSSSSSMPTFRLVARETVHGGDGGGGKSGSSSRSAMENDAGISSEIETTSLLTEEPIRDWEQLNLF